MTARLAALAAVGVVAAAACQSGDDRAATSADTEGPNWTTEQGPEDRLFTVAGLAGPEAVKYDPEQDVYFISNFGEGEGRANDGFLTRARAEDGAIETLHWATGPDQTPLIQPRGMALDGETLWVADADGVHGFDRRTGAHRSFIDMTGLEPGFLNDLAVGSDGALYVTDTGTSKVYRVADGEASVAVEGEVLGSPNGITWDASSERFWLVPWQGGDSIRAWDPTSGEVTVVARSPGGNFDGVEPVMGGFLVASQTDSALHVVVGDVGRPLIRVAGRPADIAIDTNRNRVAVPFIALDRVDVFQLPAGPATPSGMPEGD
jgi:sugar lactone lactonase YvrE